MSDLGTLLERTAERVQPDAGAFEQLRKRRDQKARNRRRMAIAVSVVIAGMGLGAIVLALPERASTPPAAEVPSSDYYVLLPEEAGPETEKPGFYEIEAKTNLPNDTIVGLYFSGQDVESPGQATVHNGQIDISVANNTCVQTGGRLKGSSFDLTVRVAARNTYPIYGGAVRPSPAPSPFQPESVRAILGDNFERLNGEQVRVTPEGNELVAARHYQLPAETCMS